MPIVLKSGNLNLLELSGSVQACNGIALPFIFFLSQLIIFEYFPLLPQERGLLDVDYSYLIMLVKYRYQINLINIIFMYGKFFFFFFRVTCKGLVASTFFFCSSLQSCLQLVLSLSSVTIVTLCSGTGQP